MEFSATPAQQTGQPLVVSSTAQQSESPREIHGLAPAGAETIKISNQRAPISPGVRGENRDTTHPGSQTLDGNSLQYTHSPHPISPSTPQTTPAFGITMSHPHNSFPIQQNPGASHQGSSLHAPYRYHFMDQRTPGTVYYTVPTRPTPFYYNHTPHVYTTNSAQIPHPQRPYFFGPSYSVPYQHSYATAGNPNHSQVQQPAYSNYAYEQQQLSQPFYATEHPPPGHQAESIRTTLPQQKLPPPLPVLPPYIRRHSHPPRQNPRTSERYGWNQRTTAMGQHRKEADCEYHNADKPHGSVAGQPTSISLSSNISLPAQSNRHALSLGSAVTAIPVPTKPLKSPTQTLPQRTSLSEVSPTLPRGPPRKPRQSGHALWVGNLPPGTNVIELKDYFSNGASNDIESVFLISKSNCAFINYKTDLSCNEAMARFHDSRFKGVRLVCRLRRNSNSAPGAPVKNEKPTEGNQTDQDAKEGMGSDFENAEVFNNGVEEPQMTVEGGAKELDGREGLRDRIFIVKSLTVEDLDLSVKNGIWATQSHNEEILNDAFEASENVYLIFSANKSGEYYGYARMASKIPTQSIDTAEWSPRPVMHSSATAVFRDGQLPEALLPKAIFTPATSTAPAGRIIDDSARGTIFWEVIDDSSVESSEVTRGNYEEDDLSVMTQSWGRPFRVEWLSTTKIPFYKTRGLRNSWNSNREVKIARDGTEVEAAVGRKLLQMFHRGSTTGAT